MPANVKEIVSGYLRSNGFAGLWNSEGDTCGCKIGDLMPCADGFGSGDSIPRCEPGYLAPCSEDDCEMGGGCEFHIVRDRPKIIATCLDCHWSGDEKLARVDFGGNEHCPVCDRELSPVRRRGSS